MNFKTVKTTLALATGGLLLSCAEINSSWEVDGGGYIKYKVNGEGPFTIELSEDDVEVPDAYRHYLYLKTRKEESKRGDQISLMVSNPKTASKLDPVSKANVNGHIQDITWMELQNSEGQGPLVDDSTHNSYIKFDEIIKDSLYTADLNLYFQDCRRGACDENLPPIHVTGRLRYWIPMDERD